MPSITSLRASQSVLSQVFEVRGLTRILRCEVVEGGRERGTIHFLNEAKIWERQPSNYYTHIGLVHETPGFVAHIKRTGSISGSVCGSQRVEEGWIDIF